MEAQQELKAHGDHQNPSSLQCQTQVVFDVSHQRRSANYKPSLWEYDFLESLTSKYDRKEYSREAEKLIKDVKDMFVETENLLAKLELIDSIKKLGLAYHFEKEMKKAIDTIATNLMQGKYPFVGHDDLYLASLCFKLLRQQCHHVSQDMFRGFMGDTKCVSVKAALELLEASHVAFEGESAMDEARASAKELLLRNSSTNFNNSLSSFGNNNIIVEHALEIPRHWRVSWFDVKWQMNAYEQQHIHYFHDNVDCGDTHTILLDLAKLNFNMVQATLQKDLIELSSWWKNLGLTQKLNFARDRLVESFMCTVGLAFQPQYKCLRKCLTKVVNFILIIDDVYDLYGSLDELKHFTNAIDRWDFKEIEQLPDCMKICFQAIYDTTCEIANDIETEIGYKLVLPHLQKAWADFCKSLLVEAEWYHKGYIPSFQEYLSNAWISSSGPLLLIHSYFCTTHHDDDVKQEISQYFEKNQDLVYDISLIIRLCNDIGTSAAEQERGDAPSSIICYMKEMDTTEDIARENIYGMIAKAWQKINKKCFATNSTPTSFVDIALNAARVAHSLYQSGDAFGLQVTENKKLIVSLLFKPLNLNSQCR